MERRPSAPTILLYTSVPAFVALAMTAAGCGGPGKTQTPPVAASTPGKPIWTDSTTASTPTDAGTLAEPRGPLDTYASDLQSMFEQLQAAAERPDTPPPDMPAPSGAPSTAEPVAAAPAEPINPVGQPAAPAAPLDADTAPADPEPGAAPAEPTPAQRRADLLAQLAAMVAQGDGESTGAAGPEASPLYRAVRLAALEAIQPGAAGSELDRLERELLPAEAAVFAPLRELLARLGESSAVTGDPAGLASLLDEAAQRAGASRPLTVPAAILCERVESFGRYTPFASTTFAAGREHAAILYVEVAHFAQRAPGGDAAAPGSSADSWTTELGQSVDLHHDADGSLQWRQPEQVVRDSSRRKRSDYYLVQRITLPATLSVGRYNLKVTVTDKISGRTAQARIPLQIVADPSLVQVR